MIAWDVITTLDLPFYCSEDLAWGGFGRALLSIEEGLNSLDLANDELLDWATRQTVDYFRAEFSTAQGRVILN